MASAVRTAGSSSAGRVGAHTTYTLQVSVIRKIPGASSDTGDSVMSRMVPIPCQRRKDGRSHHHKRQAGRDLAD
ncbi:hypothetical protein GCM10022225_71890 [Plantactinospora mayteni]|uniref:Uncharacterized protein n=1 Tax=Plantactinospora mayteni TaxID=566021 RepID=A0ABQ4F154_9ACTN|nr:hypothetical protein Pma05_72150 [Plantactinospora mayteni]